MEFNTINMNTTIIYNDIKNGERGGNIIKKIHPAKLHSNVLYNKYKVGNESVI